MRNGVDITAQLREFYNLGTYSDLYGSNALLENLLATGLATEVDFTLDNTLLAISEAGSTAFIAKKETDGLRVTSVPEPATMLLFGFGGLLLRRKCKA